jgi:putative transposase
MSKIKSSRHSKYNINYHIVWIPKYRKPILVKEVKQKLEPIFKEIAKGKGLDILAMEIQRDHLHLFVSSPPKYSPALIVNWLKGISARMYNHRFKTKIKWTRAYYIGTAGTVTTETIKKYIEEQSCKSKRQ